MANLNFNVKNGLSIGVGGTIINTSGPNVGIGVTNPTSPLQVSGTVAATTFSGSGSLLTSIPNTALSNPSLTITTSSGLSGGGSVSLGGSLTLTNTGVTSLSASGIGLSVNSSTGSVTISSGATVTSTPNTVVARDDSGNFAAGIITATLNGNANTATTATNVNGGSVSATSGTFTGPISATTGTFTGLISGTTATFSSGITAASLTGSLSSSNLTGTIPSSVLGNSSLFIGTTQIALNRASGSQTLTGVNIDGNAATATTATTATNVVGTAGRVLYNSGTNTTTTSANLTFDGTNLVVAGSITASSYTGLASGSTSANTPNTLVLRDASGNFSAGTITANLTGTASAATNATNILGPASRIPYNSSTNTTTTSTNLQFDGTNLTVGGTIYGNAAFVALSPTITQNKVISTSYNELSVGPVTVQNGVTVTVNSGAQWTVV